MLLTDLMIPACSDLVSLSIDIWTKSEETDGIRLVVAGDIGNKPLVVNDLQPPPVCRYLKVTFSTIIITFTVQKKAVFGESE